MTVIMSCLLNDNRIALWPMVIGSNERRWLVSMEAPPFSIDEIKRPSPVRIEEFSRKPDGKSIGYPHHLFCITTRRSSTRAGPDTHRLYALRVRPGGRGQTTGRKGGPATTPGGRPTGPRRGRAPPPPPERAPPQNRSGGGAAKCRTAAPPAPHFRPPRRSSR